MRGWTNHPMFSLSSAKPMTKNIAEAIINPQFIPSSSSSCWCVSCAIFNLFWFLHAKIKQRFCNQVAKWSWLYIFFVQARIWRLSIHIASGFGTNDFRKKWHVRNDVYGLVKWFIMNELSFNLRSPCTLRHFVPCLVPFHRVKCHRSYARLPQIILRFIINHATLTIILPCNSVRVVLLIARGWRGTSLPRVNVRKEIQRHRCCAFSVKAWFQWED